MKRKIGKDTVDNVWL